jgi:hypothetical protein
MFLCTSGFLGTLCTGRMNVLLMAPVHTSLCACVCSLVEAGRRSAQGAPTLKTPALIPTEAWWVPRLPSLSGEVRCWVSWKPFHSSN